MHTLAILLLAATSQTPAVHASNFAEPPATQSALVKIPESPDGLTLYNERGERVAQCDKKDDTFSNCKIESGVTFDDEPNSRVHAIRDIQSK